MHGFISRFSRRLGLIAVGALALAAGIAYASIPDGSGTIHACVSGGQGQVRIVDPAQASCKTNETSLDWSQTGPQGLQGPAGPAGPTGPAGGLNHVQVVSANGTAPPSGGFVTLLINCPAGTTLTGGGASVSGLVGDNDGFGPRIIASRPFNPNQWEAQALSPSQWVGTAKNTQWELEGYALCAS